MLRAGIWQEPLHAGEWDESKHPRDERGRFVWTSSGGSREQKVGHTRITYGVNAEKHEAELILIETPRAKRGQGSAGKALDTFLSEADRHGMTVKLHAIPRDRHTDQRRLMNFYQSRGFQLVGTDRMVRPPARPGT